MIRSEQLDLDNIFGLLVPRNEYNKETILKMLGKLTEQQLYDLGLAVISRADMLNKLALLDKEEQELLFGEGGLKEMIISSMSSMTINQFQATGIDKYLTTDKLIELLGLLDESDLEKLGIVNETRDSLVEKLKELTEAEKTTLGINYTARFNQYDTDISNLKTQTSDLKTNVNSLSSRMTTAEGQITGLNNTVNQHQTAINENTTNISNLTERVTANESSINNLNNSVTTINSNITNVTKEITTLKNDASTTSESITELEAKVNANTTTNTSQASSIQSINSQLGVLQNSINSNTTAINTNNASINSINERISSLETTLAGTTVISINDTLYASNWSKLYNDTDDTRYTYKYVNDDVRSTTIVTATFSPADIVGGTTAGIRDDIDSFDGYIYFYADASNVPTADIPVTISFKKG